MIGVQTDARLAQVAVSSFWYIADSRNPPTNLDKSSPAAPISVDTCSARVSLLAEADPVTPMRLLLAPAFFGPSIPLTSLRGRSPQTSESSSSTSPVGAAVDSVHCSPLFKFSVQIAVDHFCSIHIALQITSVSGWTLPQPKTTCSFCILRSRGDEQFAVRALHRTRVLAMQPHPP